MRRNAMSPWMVFLGLGLLVSCARRPEPLSAPVLDDRTLRFPVSTDAEAIQVGTPGVPAVLDGETLRALTLVSRDLFPLGSAAAACESRPESYTYRVLRQDGLLFVYVDENPSACGRRFPSLDSGAKYALRPDGRILRRVVDGVDEDDDPRGVMLPDGGVSPVLIPSGQGVLPSDAGIGDAGPVPFVQ
jgi:hypothetical protein